MTNDPYKILVKDYHFNSHAHVERDQTKTETLDLKKNFNSHAHVERDPVSADYPAETAISTHTLTWSVTIILKIL